MWKKLILISIVIWATFSWWHSRPVKYEPGVEVAQLPMQSAADGVSAFEYKNYQITPLAHFSAEARVLSRENYRMGREADLVKTDFALGWGRMSDKAILDQVDIKQSNRFYFWHVDSFPIPRREIETSSANMHLIPSNSDIESKLAKVRVGQIVNLRGYLVRVDASDGWHWVSSLTREDTGAGACEVVWVEELSSL